MSALLCCNGLQPYRAIRTEHDSKFTRFMAWAAYPQESAPPQGEITLDEDTYVIQMVRQVNFGPVEAKRYLAPGPSSNNFIEVQERDLINANFSKVNSYKNFKCTQHNKFFELNLYKKDPVNKHHWRANIARPASEIDI